MLPKIMHHCAFLIITFSSSYILCIQNVKNVSSSSSLSTSSVDKLKRKQFHSPEARQSFFHQNEFDNSGFQPSNEPTGFRFPDKHEYNTNNPNELPPPSSSSLSFRYPNPYQNNREVANNVNEEEANPYNLALNTGEHSTNNGANNLNNYYPYQQHANAIVGFGHHHHHRDSPNTPNANDFYLSHQQSPSSLPPLYHQQHLNNKNPYYPTPPPTSHHHPYHDYQPIQRRPTYAQAFGNYLFNGQPNYYNRRRPTPPPPPPASSFGSGSSYSPYQDGHLTGPYPYDDLTSPSGPSTTYPSHQYANQFGNFGSSGGFGSTPTSTATATTTGSANPLESLLNTIGGPFAGGNPLSIQIIRGLENIARNDDLQCVPKVLCQMLGSPTRRAQFPSFITSPVLTRFVASLPPLSPALIYGRAALLGLTGGEYSCTRTYNKCPQNEDDILYYLNNHRGGFFKFFSEPDNQDTQQQQHQYTTQPPNTPSYNQQQSLEPSIFNFLTGLGPTSSSTSTTTTNTNQGNTVNSFMSDAVTNGIGSLFGNIISGFLNGQGGATRRNDNEEDDNIDVDEKPEKYSDLIESNSTTTENPDDDAEQVEGRILNNKSNILAYTEPIQHDNPISFPPENGNDNYETQQQFQSEFRFPNTPLRDTDEDVEQTDGGDYRRGKRVNFIDSQDDFRPTPSNHQTKMIFPDRTGTGNLRFDNDEYFRVGKILNRPTDYNRVLREREKYRTTTTTTRKPSNYYASQNSGYFDRYASSNYNNNNNNYRQDYNQNQYQNKENEEDTSGNVYVTNSQGITEYYINANGKKIYV